MSEYATEAESAVFIVEDTRMASQKQLDQMLDDRGAWEMGAEAYKVLYQIAIELIEHARGEA